MMQKKPLWLLATLAAALLIGCAGQKQPATQAVAAVDSAFAAVRESAEKYLPDQVAPIESQISSLKDSLTKGDYKAVLASAPAVTTAISGLKDAVAAKQAEVEAALAKAKDQWGSFSTDVPKMLEAIQSRVAVLSKSRKLPANVSKSGLESAKSGLASLQSTWGEATSASTSGDFTTAAAKAQEVKDKATAIMQSLGLSAS